MASAILSDTRHEQSASIPHSPISFKFFPRRYSPRCLFSSLFSAKNTPVAFSLSRDSWLVWKREDYLEEKCLFACEGSNPPGLKEGRFWHSGALWVFLEQTGVTDWKGLHRRLYKNTLSQNVWFLSSAIFRSVSGWKSNPPVSVDL